MPTKKKRVGFIPRNDVLDIINNLSYETNLSNSKIINILVEEALQKRGIFNKKSSLNDKDSNVTNLHKENPYHKEFKDNSFDSEIFDKFLMFLQFQEKMKNNSKK